METKYKLLAGGAGLLGIAALVAYSSKKEPKITVTTPAVPYDPIANADMLPGTFNPAPGLPATTLTYTATLTPYINSLY